MIIRLAHQILELTTLFARSIVVPTLLRIFQQAGPLLDLSLEAFPLSPFPPFTFSLISYPPCSSCVSLCYLLVFFSFVFGQRKRKKILELTNQHEKYCISSWCLLKPEMYLKTNFVSLDVYISAIEIVIGLSADQRKRYIL